MYSEVTVQSDPWLAWALAVGTDELPWLGWRGGSYFPFVSGSVDFITTSFLTVILRFFSLCTPFDSVSCDRLHLLQGDAGEGGMGFYTILVSLTCTYPKHTLYFIKVRKSLFRECESICFLIKFGICPLLWSYVKNLIAFSLSPEPRLVQPKQIYSCTQQLARPCRVGAMKMQRQITSVMSSHMCLRMQRCDEHKVFACCILASKAAKLNWSWSLKDLRRQKADIRNRPKM